MGKRGGFNQKVTDNSRDAAPVAGKGVHQLRGGMVGGDASNAFKSTSEGLHKDGAIGTGARLFGTDLGLAILANIEVVGAEQL